MIPEDTSPEMHKLQMHMLSEQRWVKLLKDSDIVKTLRPVVKVQ